jgi:Leucine-rich repeat (LRR) protein
MKTSFGKIECLLIYSLLALTLDLAGCRQSDPAPPTGPVDPGPQEEEIPELRTVAYILKSMGLPDLRAPSENFSSSGEYIGSKSFFMYQGKVTQLNLHGNGAPADLPDTVASLTGLIDLSITGFADCKIPDRVGNLQGLIFLTLDSLGLKEVPACIRSLGDLRELTMRYNRFSRIGSEELSLRNLDSLDLSEDGLASFPDISALAPKLTRLGLAGNELTGDPASLPGLPHLQSIVLSRNAFASFPASVAADRSLQYLFMADNQLTDLPEEFTQLDSLISVEFSGNRFASIPKPLLKSDRIFSVSLARNRISELPDLTNVWPLLNTLDMEKNQLDSLSKGIENVGGGHPTWLEFAGNHLKSMPLSILNLDFGRWVNEGTETFDKGGINVDGNELCDIDPAIAAWLDTSSVDPHRSGRSKWREKQVCP